MGRYGVIGQVRGDGSSIEASGGEEPERHVWRERGAELWDIGCGLSASGLWLMSMLAVNRPNDCVVTWLCQALQHELAEGVREGVHSLSETVHHLHEGLAERMHSLQDGLSETVHSLQETVQHLPGLAETVHSLQEKVQHLPGVAAALEALSNVLCWPTPR